MNANSLFTLTEKNTLISSLAAGFNILKLLQFQELTPQTTKQSQKRAIVSLYLFFFRLTIVRKNFFFLS